MRKMILQACKKLEMVECAVPEPGRSQVRIKVQCVGVCGSDLTIYRGLHPYVTMPVVMGHEIAGVIDAVGADVTNLKPGQRVAVIPHKVCGECEACRTETYNFCEKLCCTGAEADGAYCDYFCIEGCMALPIPDKMTIEDAALLEPACVAYHGAKRGSIKKDDVALVVGAGPIGIFCMQSCKALGAKKVYIADLDANRLELARQLGADGVINVGRESLETGVKRLCGMQEKVEVYYDCVGEKGFVLNQILGMAHRGTRIVVVGVLQKQYDIPNLPDFVQHEQTLLGTTMYVPADYREMIGHMAEDRIRTEGMISHTIGLEELPELLKKQDEKAIQTFKVMVRIAD